MKFFGLTITFSLLAEDFSSLSKEKTLGKIVDNIPVAANNFPQNSTFPWQLPNFFPNIQDGTGKKTLAPVRSGNVMVNLEK